ncbi:hypothetical protein PHJA_001490400 [Phtheirospermum japonicum]|uniref:Uncharacterized protein n=1 Tax=Phtheirospermum japonicum TaxID=374723 RepID=A0A830C1D2_9LAMI|nr:hypothetical protein PHJA_001490400 [Phtheirospermum japonicum]
MIPLSSRKLESPPASEDALVELLKGSFKVMSGFVVSATKAEKFLIRLTDRVVEVRMAVLEHVKACLLVNPSRAEAPQKISALCDRLLDCDENVRKKVVSVVCDVAYHALHLYKLKQSSWSQSDFGTNLYVLVANVQILVKRYTMERLADIHRISCTSRSGGSTENDAYDWIVGKILRCFYDKDFRIRWTNWVRVFSGVRTKVEVKALEKIVEQKQRLQQEMRKYVSLRQLPEV